VLSGRDDGQLTLLVIGYLLMAVLLILVGVDVSAAFLARRSLSSVADAAALSAAQQVDRAALYAGAAPDCGTALPVDATAAERAVDASVDDDLPDLHHEFTDLGPPETTVAGGEVAVRLSGRAALPFEHVLALLLPGHAPGVPITVTAHAESAVSGAAGC
jgi:uncharacterized membrane protein